MTMEIPTPACALVRNDTNIENAAAYTNSPLTSAGGQGCVPHGSAHHRTTPSGSGQKRTHIKFVTAWLRALPGKRSFTAKTIPSGSGKKQLHISCARLVRRHCRQTIIYYKRFRHDGIASPFDTKSGLLEKTMLRFGEKHDMIIKTHTPGSGKNKNGGIRNVNADGFSLVRRRQRQYQALGY